ncbi:MAG: hypothetical protein WKG01_30345 [Kofleriaceae bacterium]
MITLAAPVAADEPEVSPSALASAPASDAASGVAIEAPRNTHPISNALLSVPRVLVLAVWTGPRLLAGELDDYLDSLGPNVAGKGTTQRWRFGVAFDMETTIGASFGIRAGYRIADHVAVDVVGGLFGARGQSGHAKIQLGRYTTANLAPVVELATGRDMGRVFAGVGEQAGDPRDPYRRGPRTEYDERRFAGDASLAAHRGPVELTAHGRVEATKTEDDDDHPVREAYDPEALVGFEDRQRAGTIELALSYDSRHPASLIPSSAPSTGWLFRGLAAYTRGDTSRIARSRPVAPCSRRGACSTCFTAIACCRSG